MGNRSKTSDGAASAVVAGRRGRISWGTVVAVALAVPAVVTPSVPEAVASGVTAATSNGTVADVPVLGDFVPSNFREEAAELDPGLVEAIARDLEMSAEEYLAQAAATAAASDLVEYLEQQGIDASDRRIDGTTVTIAVSSPAEAELVESLGAETVIGALPPAPVPGEEVVFEAATSVYGGDLIAWLDGGGDARRCSVGVNGTDASGEPQLLTAGHCSSTTLGNGGLYRHVEILVPGFSPSGPFGNIGSQRVGSFQKGGGYDVGLLRVTEAGFTPEPVVTTFNGGLGDRSTGLVAVRDTIIPTTGATVCKSGATTGWTCGRITNAKVINQQISNYFTDVFLTDVCMLGGDSGGPALVGNSFVGINSGSAFAVGRESQIATYTGTPVEFCAAAAPERKLSAMAIMRHEPGVRTVETLYGSTWEPTVLVDQPTVAVPATVTPGARLTVSGGLTNATSRSRIVVTVNGVTYTATPADSNGEWSVTTDPMSGSSAQLTVQARWGQRSGSETLRFDVSSGQTGQPGPPEVQRISGADRYDVAIGIAQRAYPGPTKPATVHVVNGADYPDALSAGSAAAATGGVVMLVPTTSIPSKIVTELQRLSPQRVVIVGGPAAVSEGVQATITSALPTASVTRISGSDRFETSLRVLIETPEFDVAANVYVANGYNYPDALVAGAAGSSQARLSPVLIVPGTDSSLPGSTLSAIAAESVSTIKIAGGSGAVTDAIRAQLSGIPGATVTRLGGSDRYESARSVANDAYPGTASTVFLATGVNFPDALAGAPLAGMLNAPMYSVQTTCVPPAVLADIARLQPQTIVLLGGPGALTPAVAALTPCR